jgi:hypothetical protein
MGVNRDGDSDDDDVSAADRLLSRLARVKQTRPHSWIAACPCCMSRRGRPIKVDAPEDGRLLLFAFCGCSTDDVMSALGLKLGDLFDKPLNQHLPPVRGGFSARELLELVNFEIIVASLIVTDATQAPLSPEATDRLYRASARISKALGLIDV